MDLEGAVCLVTGASSGIGHATARALARRGAHLLAAGRDRAALNSVAEATGGRTFVADLARVEEVERLASEAEAAHGRVDVLVNNAAVGWAGPLAEMPSEVADAILAVNLAAPVRLTRALLPGMLERGRGHVVNVTSVAGHVGVGGEAVYVAAKAGLNGFTESLRYDVGGHIGVSLVSPGAVDTQFFARRGAPYPRRWPRQVPPEQVAQAIVRAIERNRADVFVPRWMGFPARLRGTLPGVYRALARRFG